MKSKNTLAAALLSFTALAAAVLAQQSDITFLVVGKTANYRQQADGSVAALNYHFFAEIFRREGGTVGPAAIALPAGAGQAVTFSESGYALEVHGGRYRTEKELESAYPDGDYVFSYTTPSTGAVSQAVRLHNPRPGGSGLPAAPQIKLSQNGKSVSPDSVDPQLDLRVSWSEFEVGGADPIGIMDDLVFVIMGDCEGVRRAHSGRPFESTPFLTYTDSSFVIGAGQLLPENVYQLSVEHAVLDTSIEHGVVGFATFASTTFLDIRTGGTAAPGLACQAIRRHFDAGQEVL